ncbi:uncharacterized protein LOC124495604 [Dermatophagoides farinae]|nr:GATA zinc finger domain-containing protein 4-like [Dermatophagoides farinae]XP_046914971.1 GATA zinc finger domain-containing protein 4-like [Dermatophagoides farinae]
MFTFAQYVFGVGRSLENSNNDDNNNNNNKNKNKNNDDDNNQTLQNSVPSLQQSNSNNNNNNNKQRENSSTTLPSTTSSSFGCYANDSESNCLLTNIENDWILIDHVIDHGNNINRNKNQGKKVKSKLPTNIASNIIINNNNNSNKNLTAIRQHNITTTSKDEQWLVDPPECFKQSKRKNHHHYEKSMTNGKKAEEMENLLIEHPSMSVFDNLFVKKPAPIAMVTVQRPSLTIATSTALQPLSMNKAEQRKLILARIQQASKKLDNNKENNGKKLKSNVGSMQTFNNNVSNVPLAHLNCNNNNKALIVSIINSNDKNDRRMNKKQITKKQYQRQNKIKQQRNGPIIRQKKMFAHINGIYHNRNNC